MKQKKTVEDYLKAIYVISRQKEVHGADIAGELRVSRPTVSVVLHRDVAWPARLSADRAVCDDALVWDRRISP